MGRDHVGETATVQAGMTLLEIHEWLGKQGKEVRRMAMMTSRHGRWVRGVHASSTSSHPCLLRRPVVQLAVQPEIGDATVGSLTCSLSKDSGVGSAAETGVLFKAIVGVKYADHEG